ncbi:major facilitator superfamily domain-containing protein [Dendryphion nanum]|uniref:Major facilitator superfamily domain-containing protein n=1 Tax=Dendryphion nanum TaxID=256645 RepID=A0A9P9E3N7_9PLEO|nr:major facilitator superfamily domain-containing protein [Dendryphion nanum]
MASHRPTSPSERTPLLSPARSESSASSISFPSSSDSSDDSNDRPVSPSSKSRTVVDEEERLESRTVPPTLERLPPAIGRIVSVLLIGGFISNADGSLLLATHPVIASEFNALDDSSWLLTSFALASAAVMPLYGKLSDIYGRKMLLLVAYVLFALGLVLVGVGTSMTHLIIGRVISGAGASGMSTLVSILITDLVPLREVATWRAYINVVATTGRSIGGPLGGWLADTVGWRWSFLMQVPFTIVAIILIAVIIPSEKPNDKDEGASTQSKFARIDFTGAVLMTLSILAFLFPLEIGGVKLPWSSPYILGLFGSGLALIALFIASQAYVAKEPILPLELLRNRDVLASMIVMTFLSSAQLGLMFAVPLYFKITTRASNTVAGAHLVPAVAGNAIGGILSGVFIKRTGRYRVLALLATLIGSGAYLLLILRWHGHTNWLESLYILPGGLGMGIAQSALFIGLQAAIDPSHMAVATSSLYLASSIGMVAGMAGTSAVLQEMLRRGLEHRLDDLGYSNHKKWKIIEEAVSNIHYLDYAKGAVAKAVVGSYVEALTWTHIVSLICSLIAFVGTLFIRQHRL